MKTLILTGLVLTTVNRESFNLGAGTDIDRIELPDEKYGLTEKDVERIVRSCVGRVESSPGPREETFVPLHLSKLVDAIYQMDTENPKHWIGDGKPDIASLEKITGGQITADDRNNAWKYFLMLADQNEVNGG
ncbi:hypothetical protein [Candidatus Vondammii sp. HM_W22]|uniref:hypothetical protein n=1 Tax=Candidatus Vondammii sp. HM_W22 TaxID=2687299 RepID=UPI002E7BE47D|nr:hypothetical protein [Candidatus Vondammii sp. HM_W22]